MFESLSHLALQQYWWVIISLLGSLLVFLLFVQGGQTLIYSIGKNESERSMIVNSLGRKWEFTFTTLVTFGGAMFASFPLFYATSFGGAYWVWMLILFCFVIQAISYEYRKKPSNFLGQRTYEVFLYINGSIGVILLGTAVGTFFTGSAFQLNEMNFSQWQNPLRGLEAAFDPRNVLLGLSIFFLARVLALLYFLNNINDDILHQRVRNHLRFNLFPFLILFLTFFIDLMLSKGFAYNADGYVYTEPYKYFHNLIQMPLLMIIFIIGVLGVLWGVYIALFKKSEKGIWFSGAGTVLTVFSLFLLAGLNNTSFYPSTYDLQSSLTIENASSSKYTLTVMSYVSLIVPFVLAYIYYAWRSIDRKKIDAAEMEEEGHKY
jgi:cytochrome bd ubiquinol oxidase subunit II